MRISSLCVGFVIWHGLPGIENRLAPSVSHFVKKNGRLFLRFFDKSDVVKAHGDT